MKLTKMKKDISQFPQRLHPYLEKANIYDSSCSPQARVYYIEKDGGYFLKKAEKGQLEREMLMTRYFHAKGLSAEIIDYISERHDWLLSAKIEGDDCVTQKYLEKPEKLCDTLAELLARLHSLEFTDCPVPNHTQRYIETARKNYLTGNYDKTLFLNSFGYKSASQAWDIFEKHSHCLKTDTLLHGDYCLPNIILKDWSFSGFIDLDCGGVGDRHIDIFWGAWTLFFNLKTDRYRQRFYDAYSRADIDEDILRVVAAAEVFS